MGTKLSLHLPVIGSRFSSRARSFEASCHSLVMVCGGGLAGDQINSGVRKRERGALCVFSGLTKGSAREEYSTSGANANQDGQYELWYTTGRMKRGTGSVRSERNVISCIWREWVSDSYIFREDRAKEVVEMPRGETGYTYRLFSRPVREFSSLSSGDLQAVDEQ